MIAQKILNVMSKIGPVIKDKTNEEKGFDYASIASIIFAAREAMIEEKIIIIPLTIKQIVNKGNDVILDMIYRVYDAEPNKDGKNDYIDVNMPGEGYDKEGWAIYKALSGAYKYLLTQTFAIPTIDDAERDRYTTNTNSDNTEEDSEIIGEGLLNENNIESILGEPSMEDYGNLIGNKAIPLQENNNFDKLFTLSEK